jgi:hypothetical protein
MPTFADAMRNKLRVAIDVEFSSSEWDSGRRAILEVLETFYELREVTRWDELPWIQYMPRGGTSFRLLLRFRHAVQAVYLKAMLYRTALDHGWTFLDAL